jgi:hypothetical protein
MTTLSAQVSIIFQRFAAKTAEQENERTKGGSRIAQHTVVQIWDLVLQPGAVQIYDALSMVCAALTRLRSQVEASRFSEGGKGQIYQILNGFNQCVTPGSLNLSAISVSVHVSPQVLDVFSLAVAALHNDEREPDIEKGEVEKLTADLDDIIKDIRESHLAPTLKAILLRHATFMAWAIRNIDLVGFPAAYEAVAKVMITIPGLPEDKAASPTQTGGLKNKLRGFVRNALGVLRSAHDVKDGGEAIESFIEKGSYLIDVITG